MVRVIRFMKRTNTNVAVHLALQELTAKRHLVSSIAQTLAFGPQSLHYAKKELELDKLHFHLYSSWPQSHF